MLSKIKEYWEKVKDWFKRSETIFLARLEVLVGFIVSAFAAMDWSPIIGLGSITGLDWRQTLVIGIFMIVRGVFAEWARRRNAPEMKKA